MIASRFTPPEPDWFDFDEQEAELADRLHKEQQEFRAVETYEQEKTS